MIKSLLFVPTVEKMLNKVHSFSADGYILDLEDSIKDSEKEKAMITLLSWLSKNTTIDAALYVRLNKDSYKQEVRLLSSFPIGFMLPKMESSFDYSECMDVWLEHNVIALLETPMGILNTEEIAALNWINGLALGAEDLSASMNMENSSYSLQYAKQKLLISAKAFEKRVYDTPSFQINNRDIFEEDVLDSVRLGFDGKLCIHPNQVSFINKQFNLCDINYMKRIVALFEKSESGVLVVDGNVYEKMHISRMKRILQENK